MHLHVSRGHRGIIGRHLLLHLLCPLGGIHRKRHWRELKLLSHLLLHHQIRDVHLSHSQLLHTKAVESFKSQWKGTGLTPGLMSWSSKSLYVSLTWTAGILEICCSLRAKKKLHHQIREYILSSSSNALAASTRTSLLCSSANASKKCSKPSEAMKVALAGRRIPLTWGPLAKSDHPILDGARVSNWVDQIHPPHTPIIAEQVLISCHTFCFWCV